MSHHYSAFQNVCDLLLHCSHILPCSHTNSDEKLAHLMTAVCHLCRSTAAFFRLTIFDIRWPNATDSCPVVRHTLRGLHKLVVDAFSKLVDQGHASQDAVLSIVTHSHHLAVYGHDFGNADGWLTRGEKIYLQKRWKCTTVVLNHIELNYSGWQQWNTKSRLPCFKKIPPSF